MLNFSSSFQPAACVCNHLHTPSAAYTFTHFIAELYIPEGNADYESGCQTTNPVLLDLCTFLYFQGSKGIISHSHPIRESPEDITELMNTDTKKRSQKHHLYLKSSILLMMHIF